jgi:hypothetical protein
MVTEHALRLRAQSHLDAATALLARGEEASLRYACLELRMVMECLTYDLLRIYRNDVGDELLSEYRADKLLKQLVAIDPMADQGATLTISPADDASDGKTMSFKEHRFRARWGSKSYNTLGRFLHERTFLELETGKTESGELIRKRADSIASELGKVLAGTGYGMRLTNGLECTCDCGAVMRFRMGPQQVRTRARCATCETVYEVERDSPSKEGAPGTVRTWPVAKPAGRKAKGKSSGSL